ncbi:glycosyltransferase family 4 protein [Colwellia sp. RE-S-Sl-9]
MRILHVVSSLNVGGAERFVIDLAIEQNNSLKLKPSFLSMGKKDEPLEREIEKTYLHLFHATSIKELKIILKKYDVVHVHSSHCLLRILLASLFNPIRVVYTRHNEKVHTSIKWRLVYLLAYYKLHKMVFVAEKAKSKYLKVYPKFISKAQTVLNGVLPIDKTKNKSDRIRISHVGRFVPLKSQHVLIEALEQLPDNLKSKIDIYFYGTGELLNINKELASLKIPNVTVNFKGFVTDRNEIYKNTDILVVTSETEGLSLAILEALASGTPVIASNVGGNPELVKDNVNGFLYEYSDYHTLARKIIALIENPALYEKFSIESVRLYRQGFSMSKCAKQYFTCYQYE